MEGENELSLAFLETLKRPQLQKLCKKYGLKANGKNTGLIKNLASLSLNSAKGEDVGNSVEISKASEDPLSTEQNDIQFSEGDNSTQSIEKSVKDLSISQQSGDSTPKNAKLVTEDPLWTEQKDINLSERDNSTQHIEKSIKGLSFGEQSGDPTSNDVNQDDTPETVDVEPPLDKQKSESEKIQIISADDQINSFKKFENEKDKSENLNENKCPTSDNLQPSQGHSVLQPSADVNGPDHQKVDNDDSGSEEALSVRDSLVENAVSGIHNPEKVYLFTNLDSENTVIDQSGPCIAEGASTTDQKNIRNSPLLLSGEDHIDGNHEQRSIVDAALDLPQESESNESKSTSYPP